MVFSACKKPEFKIKSPEKGSIDATRYVALGASMTAGYADGALYFEAQQNSYAYILSEQLKLIGGGAFKVPYVNKNSVGVGNTGGAPSILGDRTDCKGIVSLGPVKVAPQGDMSIFSDNTYSTYGALNNMGVPDIKTTEALTNGYNNPFYKRMASSATSSVLGDAVAQNPTFFSVMLGLNDVLNYALKGGTTSITPVTGAAGIGFEASITKIIDDLTANGAKGVIANIPSIKTMPYFYTIPWNALDLPDDETATNLTNYYTTLDSTQFKKGKNGFIIMDSQNPYLGFRQAVEGEYILLNTPLDSIKCFKWGSLIPIPDRYSLTKTEIDKIEIAITQYNVILKNIAQTKGLAFVDVNAFYNKIQSGFVYNGVSINAAFVTGGAYSLDGLNFTPRANALLANEFVKAINQTYKSGIPQVDAMKYSSVKFP